MNTQPNALPEDNFTGANSEGAHANEPLHYLTASSITGDEVQDAKGEQLGHIKDIMLNVRTGEVQYFIVKYGGFLGVGIKYFAIPFHLLQVDPVKKVFVFSQPKEILKDAPGFDLNHWPDTNFHPQEDYWTFIPEI